MRKWYCFYCDTVNKSKDQNCISCNRNKDGKIFKEENV